MKREEALEYMNRYLDHDLNEEETETLFRHLGESPDARADFDFLQGLSDKLESLPDVQPPISLVDSILPRLEEIDRPTPFKHEEPDQPIVMLPDKHTPPRRKAAAFWRSTLGRAVGGTAVAAAVLGIFVATYKPQEMPNAEVTSTTAVSNATDDTLVSGGSAEKKAPDLTDPSTEVQEIQPEGQPVPQENATAPTADPKVEESQPAGNQDQAGNGAATTPDSSQPDSSAGTGTESRSNQASEGKQNDQAEKGTQESKKTANDGSTKDAKDKESASSPKKAPSDASKPNEAPKKNNNDASKLQSPTPPNGNPSAETKKIKPDEDVRSSDADPNKETGDANPGLRESDAAESGTMDTQQEDTRAYSLMAAPTEWASPDSTYLITYSQGVLTLLKGDRSAELETLKIEGEAANGVWSADGKTFTYDLVKTDGTTVPQIWKIEETTLKQGK